MGQATRATSDGGLRIDGQDPIELTIGCRS